MSAKVGRFGGGDFAWLKYDVDGRDVILTGQAPGSAEHAFIVENISKIPGLRTITDQIDPPPVRLPYLWAGTLNKLGLTLTGYVNGVNARRTLAYKASNLGVIKLVDNMTYAAGAAGEAGWLNKMDFALDVLTKLGSAKVELRDHRMIIDGEIDRLENYQEIVGYLDQKMPRDLILDNRIIPPKVKPFVWGLDLLPDRIGLSGYAPDLSAKKRMLAAAQKLRPAVDNKLAIASGAPGDYDKIINAAFEAAQSLETGAVRLEDNSLFVHGEAKSADDVGQLKGQWLKTLPKSIVLKELRILFPGKQGARQAVASRIVNNDILIAVADKIPLSFTNPTGCIDQLKQKINKVAVRFEKNTAKIRKNGYYFLDRLSTALLNCSNARLKIIGYTDSDGKRRYNKKLSQFRALLVAEYLMDNGIARSRLKIMGRGESNPLLPNTSDENKAYNRRIELKVFGN